jgi:hypothetical protein
MAIEASRKRGAWKVYIGDSAGPGDTEKVTQCKGLEGIPGNLWHLCIRSAKGLKIRANAGQKCLPGPKTLCYIPGPRGDGSIKGRHPFHLSNRWRRPWFK